MIKDLFKRNENKNKKDKNKEFNDKLLEKCKKKFDIYQEEDNSDLEMVTELYNYIYNKYFEKLKEGNLNIKNERIRINKSLGEYKKISEKIDSTYVVLITSLMMFGMSVFNMYIKEKVTEKALSIEGGVYLIFALIGFVMWLIMKPSVNANPSERDLVNYISLKVLDDLERGIIA